MPHTAKKNPGKYFCISLQTIKGIKSEKCLEISFSFCLIFLLCFLKDNFAKRFMRVSISSDKSVLKILPASHFLVSLFHSHRKGCLFSPPLKSKKTINYNI